MGKKGYVDPEEYMVSETGNWNVAGYYSALMIMKPLYLASQYLDMAHFGYADLTEELNLGDNNKDFLRMKGFDRLVKEVSKLIRQSVFAVKKKEQRVKLHEYKKRLKRIEKLRPILFTRSFNQLKKKSEVRVVPGKLEPILDEIEKIIEDVNFILNRSDLIFTYQEEFDPVAYKKKVIEMATTRG